MFLKKKIKTVLFPEISLKLFFDEMKSGIARISGDKSEDMFSLTVHTQTGIWSFGSILKFFYIIKLMISAVDCLRLGDLWEISLLKMNFRY